MSEEERRIAERVAEDPNQQVAKQAHDRRLRHERKGIRAEKGLEARRHKTTQPASALRAPARPPHQP